MMYIAEDLAPRVEALKLLILELVETPGLAEPGLHCQAVAQLDDAVDDLIGCAVLADRRSGATWADIGAALGLSSAAARARYGHRRLAQEWPNPL